ncbi:hypothetical protein [Microbacterium trichothecenolyticum]|uniref:Uncharacterized protein n=1 Tax=Microbacterium trichothecenolyticum TaxID=69370 RepID=A0ABU0TZ63_MICTR|nr:hypothetical protein [Microbacterium trichothecenolyticum]MDQ1124948.1 hypothetical protein [Microbacterium trichothecenolyticum]
MSYFSSAPIDRSSLFAVAIFGGISAWAFSPVVANAEELPIDPSEVPEYVEKTVGSGFTDLAGIHQEYREAVASFPFPLPDGQQFPPESSLNDDAPTSDAVRRRVVWQKGSGVAEAYMYWETATVVAASEAQDRGEFIRAQALLDTLEAGYNSDFRRLVLIDRGNEFVRTQVGAARSGDFGPLRDAVCA